MNLTQMNRRTFARMSALTLAATRLPAFAQTGAAQKPIGYAAVGLGTISDIFSRGCANSQTAKITAVVTGHGDTKGKAYAAKYGFPESSIYSYETFDRIRDNKDVDAIYVGLPNSMHREYTLRGAAAGKHVFCEKPMAISSAECRDMIAACRKANVKLMIGYRVHYTPAHLEVFKAVRAGDLGEIQAFEGGFGFSSQPGLWRLTKKYGGGGSLMDVGIYPLNEIRWLTGEEPTGFSAFASTRDHGGRFTEVEQTLAFNIKMPSGIVAALTCSYGENIGAFLNIHGSQRSLQITNAYGYSNVRVAGNRGAAPADAAPGRDSDQFQAEAEYFANCIRTNTEPATAGEEGLKDLLAIEAIYKAAGTPIA